MGAINFQATDFQQALLNYLPRGRAWPKDPNSVQGQVMLALAQTFARIAAAAVGLLTDTLPSTTVNLLPEWQESLGLPDACTGPPANLAAAQAQCAARFAGNTGQSQADIIAYALTFGYAITITTFAPARAGIACAGQPCYGQDWIFAWQINWRPATGWNWTNDAVLACELGRIAQAHTVLIFERAGPPGELDFSKTRQSALAGN
jgi:uncharacterized protein YmfQ (DUF2313 family)